MYYELWTIEVTRTTPNPSFMKGGDYEMEARAWNSELEELSTPIYHLSFIIYHLAKRSAAPHLSFII